MTLLDNSQEVSPFMHEVPLSSLAQAVWKTLLGLDIEPSITSEFRLDSADYLLAQVDFHDAWNGCMVIQCPKALAQLFASLMFAQPAHALDFSQLEDALGEIANVTAGNIKALLPSDTKVSLPSVKHSADLPCGPFIAADRVDLRCSGYEFVLCVYERAASVPEISSESALANSPSVHLTLRPR